MSSLRTLYKFGMQGRSADFNTDGTAIGTMVGELMSAFVGDTEVLPVQNALAVVPGTGLSVNVGGPGQFVFVRDVNGALQLADFITEQAVTFAPADATQTRIDLLSFTYSEGDAGDFQVAYEDPQGNVSTPPGGITTNYIARTINLVLTEGTPGQPAPAVPAGFHALAHVQILANATTLTTANINVVVPTINQALASSGSVPTPGFLSDDGYLFFRTNGNVVTISLYKPYPTEYSSPDGSIDFALLGVNPEIDPVLPNNPITLQLKVNLANATAATQIGSSNSLAYNAGIVFYRQRGNAGTNEPNLEIGTPLYPYTGGSNYEGYPAPGDASISPVGSFNGAVSFNSEYTGPQTNQAEFLVKAVAGSGGVIIGGANSNNATLSNGTCTVYFDNNVISTLTGPTNSTFTWSTTVPDDGNFHILVFHINFDGPISAQWNVWLPLSSGGGVDATKIAVVSPT